MRSHNIYNLLIVFFALSGIVACSNGIGSNNTPKMDARVEATLSAMFETYPGTQQLAEKSSGMLVMPLTTEAGFGLGAGFGRGALRINDANVDYYSAVSASIGFQIGSQQYSHVLFFMTDNALRDFRTSRGWAVGANVEYVLQDSADSFSANTTTSSGPVIAIMFAQAGIRLGATLDGTKYTRIIP